MLLARLRDSEMEGKSLVMGGNQIDPQLAKLALLQADPISFETLAKLPGLRKTPKTGVGRGSWWRGGRGANRERKRNEKS